MSITSLVTEQTKLGIVCKTQDGKDAGVIVYQYGAWVAKPAYVSDAISRPVTFISLLAAEYYMLSAAIEAEACNH